ncbi:hypothetical protein LguiB_035709 [Lonicera macranthoides]
MSANRRARLVLWAWTHIPEDTTIGIRGQWSIHALVKQYRGHTSVNIGKSKIVVFGGLVDKKFLSDIAVFDIGEHLGQALGPLSIALIVVFSLTLFQLWLFQKMDYGFSQSVLALVLMGKWGPAHEHFTLPFQLTVICLFLVEDPVAKGLYMAMVGAYQFGDLPSPRDFAAASAIGNRKIVMYGGWDGKKWLSDVFILDTNSLEWMELSVSGSLPPPRCGHTATMVEKRFLVYGGRGGGGPIMGGLGALKGLIEEDMMSKFTYALSLLWKEENETPGWTQLKLPGQSPSPRCGHTVTSGGHYLLLFGGHGTGGWLSRYDIYHNDTVVLDRGERFSEKILGDLVIVDNLFAYAMAAMGVAQLILLSVHWKRLTTTNDPPPARAYHSVTCIGSRYLLFGGFDGKMTYGDLWWLVPEGIDFSFD